MKNISETLKNSISEAKVHEITVKDLDAFIKKHPEVKWNVEDSAGRHYNFEAPENNLRNCDILCKNGFKPNRIPGVLYSSSQGDGYECVVRILDWEQTVQGYSTGRIDPKRQGNKDLFDALDKAGLSEVNRKRCAQWGTWKFILNDTDDLNTFGKILKNLLK